MTLTEALAALDGKPDLSADDAVAIRRIVFSGDCTVSQDEADALFKLNADAGELSPEWSALFVEAMVDHVVRQAAPEGYVDEAKADWLIASVSKYRRLRADEIEMLIYVLEQADQTPAKLSAFVLAMLKSLILWKAEHQGRVSPEDVERLRRALYAAGGEASDGVTRHEADLLFDINDALKTTPAEPAWTDLFVRGVANAVLFKALWTPDAAAETKREAWLEDTSIHPFARLAGLAHAKATGAGMIEGLREVIHWDFANHDLEPAEAADEALEADAGQLTAEEAQWLAGRIGRDGRLDANERALVAFIRDNARTVDPSLQSLIDQLDAPAAAPAPPPAATAAPVVFGRRNAAPAAG
ncbi:MAG TPA: hypothetical protein VHZ26_20600 [Caulobacteraceae bacterium]|jgi:hypothetical protein|nr:hypothetical protein [Caulobacteraceae bacterium]